MSINTFADHYYNANRIEEKKNSTSQIIIWGHCNIFQNEYSKIIDAKLFLFQAYMYNRILRKHITIIK